MYAEGKTILPDGAEAIMEYRFPDYLGYEAVRHSVEAYTVVLLDLDYKHYTFRLIESLDHRWSLTPISGFDDLGEWFEKQRKEHT